MSGSAVSTYYSVDVEASGPVPGLFNLLSVGVTAVHPGDGGALQLGDELYVELRPVFAGHVAESNAVHGLDLERLAAEGLEPAEAMRRITAFVERTRTPGSEAVFVGHVAVFDWMFIAWYYAWCGQENPFGYKGLDTKSLAVGALGLPWQETSKERLAAELGLPEQDDATLHRADADARHQAELLVRLLEASGKG